ncbi:hypothetical protein F5141DRAFT_558386 [Pisolithus sp. B1]|nr:hypothetical protein F5141DRAFT_558386 [Pisolithus sp. B1]
MYFSLMETIFTEVLISVCRFVDHKTSTLTETWYYSVTPSAATVVAAEVLITVSLCILLYDGGSYSPFPRAKRLVNTLIIYAINRCLLALLVSLGVLAVNVDQQSSWTMGLDLIVGKLYTNSLLASLNTREYLRSQSSTAMSILNLSALHSADPSTLAGDVGSSKNGGRRFDCARTGLILTSSPNRHPIRLRRCEQMQRRNFSSAMLRPPHFSFFRQYHPL